MRIQNDNPATRFLYDAALMGEHYDPPGIEFSADGVARVKASVGEALADSDRYPSISRAEADDGDTDDDTDDS